ncbi:hypothetical protein DPEC_G00329190 [Dallia pectoralis]|uniref:Uncharacterized protein n=1 Tax=Dallia pectoralis TaxID=75939 RepID=A0ACC2F8I2_DALPE|nr:hypothetical protein DPEC_G00329190 [Dallia pectoralis]
MVWLRPGNLYCDSTPQTSRELICITHFEAKEGYCVLSSTRSRATIFVPMILAEREPGTLGAAVQKGSQLEKDRRGVRKVRRGAGASLSVRTKELRELGFTAGA